VLISASLSAAQLPPEALAQIGPITIKQQPPVDALLERLAQSDPSSLKRDVTGNVVSLNVYRSAVNDENLHLISGLQSILALHLQCPAQNLTKEGIRFIGNLTNLESLTLACMGQLKGGVFEEISKLQSLHRLTLSQTCPPVEEFPSIVRLKLIELAVDHCESFSDKQLTVLTNVTTLKSIELVWTSVSPTGTNILSCFPAMTNARVLLRDK